MYVFIILLPNKFWLIVAAVEGDFTFFFFFYCFSTLTFRTPLWIYLWLWSVSLRSAHRQVLWKCSSCPQTRLCLHLQYSSGWKMSEAPDFQWGRDVCMQTGGHQAEETFANSAVIIHSAASREAKLIKIFILAITWLYACNWSRPPSLRAGASAALLTIHVSMLVKGIWH